MNIETLLVHGAREEETTGAASMPIYQVSSFRHHTVGQKGGYQYSRVSNPTRDALEEQMALLEMGSRGFAFASGMAAITAVFSLFKSGDHIITSSKLYGGTFRVLEQVFSRFGLKVSYVDLSNKDVIARAITQETRAIYIETPSNPTLMVTDIRMIAELAVERGLLTIADNTFMSPYLQQPLALGIDIVIHSATKFIGGHSDVTAGIVVVKEEKLADEMHFLQMSTGGVLGPFDSWLLLRGLKTLGIRMDRQINNALKVANWLKARVEIEKIYFLGFNDHPHYSLHKTQAKAAGNVISFDVGDKEMAYKILSKVKLCMLGDSLGGVETLINLSDVMSHGSMPTEIKRTTGITPSLIRLSVGIENTEDIIADLKQAFES